MFGLLIFFQNLEIKRLFSSKIVLEHDLGLTRSAHLRSLDDGILASLVYLSKCTEEIGEAWREHAACLAPQNDQAGRSITLFEKTFDNADIDFFDGLIDQKKDLLKDKNLKEESLKMVSP